jgi:hypothetical protein
MKYKLNITGKSMNEVYIITFPDNLLRFIKYDFSGFMEQCIQTCRTSMKKGTVDRDEISVMRSSIAPCHKYFEKNIHGIFEKIVIDCWIEYICRQNEIGYSTLWNSFMGCKNSFEAALFARLSEYRYNHAINQWVNLIRMQEYALKKTDFIYGKKLDNPAVAIAKGGYFDLLFNVAANEMGYGDLSASRVYSSLRTPNSPFIMSGISREIMRNVLPGIDFPEDTDTPLQAVCTDKSAMDAFAAIKNAIPDEPDTIINTIMKSIPHTVQQVYIPESFKAVIDLELDALAASGAVVQKCGRCLEYFRKDESYNYDYCSNLEGGRSCLGIMDDKMAAAKAESASVVDAATLHARCDQLYKEMAQRVNVDINQRDFSDWYKYMVLIRDNVIGGRASMDDFENFVEYSRTISFIPPNRVTQYSQYKESVTPKRDTGKQPKKPKTKQQQKLENIKKQQEIRKFVFEKVERRDTDEYDEPPAQPFAVMPAALSSAYTPTTRIIRGVVPQGINFLGGDIPEPVPEPVMVSGVEKPPVIETVVEEILPEPDEIIQEVADEVIEEVAEEPVPDPKIDEFVRVFQQSPEPWRPKVPPSAKRGKAGKPAKHGKYEKGSLLQNPYIREIINIDESGEAAGEAAAPPVKSVPPVLEALSAEADVPKLDFNSILSGIKRNDGFEKPKAADSAEEEMPVSHKTKRVMDAIFGKTKTVNPFVAKDLKQDEDND